MIAYERNSAADRGDAYSAITRKFIERMAEGEIPWRKPWATLPPQNLLSRCPYRGINVWVLLLQGYDSPYWATWKQIHERGGRVRKGEKSTSIVFWKWLTKRQRNEDGADEELEVAFCRTFNVWNLAQTEGLTEPVVEAASHEPLAACEALLRNIPHPPRIVQGGQRAYYRIPTDTVQIPPLGAFRSPEAYYGTLFHELVHATGHSSRLNRYTLEQMVGFGQLSYSKEELVAELGASFLCHHCGIVTPELFENSVAYLQGWISAFKEDERMLVQSAQAAQKAVDYLLNQRATEGE